MCQFRDETAPGFSVYYIYLISDTSQIRFAGNQLTRSRILLTPHAKSQKKGLASRDNCYAVVNVHSHINITDTLHRLKYIYTHKSLHIHRNTFTKRFKEDWNRACTRRRGSSGCWERHARCAVLNFYSQINITDKLHRLNTHTHTCTLTNCYIYTETSLPKCLRKKGSELKHV